MGLFSEDYVCHLTDTEQKYACKNLNETEENRRNGFRKIKQWAERYPDLKVRTEDKYILLFLRACKFDLEKTKEKMKNYYTMKRKRSDWFKNRNPKLPELQEMVKKGTTLLMTQEEKTVLIVRVISEPQLLNIDTLVKITFMIADIAMLENELIQIYGGAVIIDMQNVSIMYVKQLTPNLIKSLIQATLNYPGRPQNIQIINTPSYISIIFRIFMSILPAKLKSRVSISSAGDISNVDRCMLPREYGGDAGTIDEITDYWLKKLSAYSNWFEEDE